MCQTVFLNTPLVVFFDGRQNIIRVYTEIFSSLKSFTNIIL